MGQANIRRKNGAAPRTPQLSAMALNEARQRRLARLPRIGPMVLEVGGDTLIALMDFNSKEGSSPRYRYGTKTGTVTRTDDWPVGGWIGEIIISPSVGQRTLGAVNNHLQEFNIPTEPDELKKFIDARCATKSGRGPWYVIGDPESKTNHGSFYLPKMWGFIKAIQSEKHQGTVEKPEGTAVISSACVAPQHVGRGFGTALHVLAAGHFKQLGYESLSSDLVGLNTDSEVAVWKRLGKDFTVDSFMENPISIPRLLKNCGAIDDDMAQFLNTRTGMHVNGKMMKLEEVANTAFPQFEMDLTDERVPVLLKQDRSGSGANG